MKFLSGISDIMEKAKRTESSGEFMKVVSLLSERREAVREAIQEVTSKEIREIISKLESNKPLTTEELKYVELWIVGDAESYTEMENNFQDWLNEFKRLQNVLSKYEDKELPLEDLFKLQGILEDAIRVSSDISNFLEKKERIGKFKEATKDLASLDREVLSIILKRKLAFPDM